MIKPFVEVLNLYLREGNRDNKPKSRKRDEVSGESLKRFFRGWNVSNVSGARVIKGKVVSDYREWRKSGGASPATIARDISVASSAINYCIRDLDWDLLNPFEKRAYSSADRKKISPRHRVLTEAEESALLAHASGVLRDLILFYLETGVRATEALNLEWSRVVDDMVIFNADDHKSGYVDTCLLNQAALDVIARQPKHDTFVFNMDGQKVSYYWLRGAWKRLKIKAGITDLRIHDLRKTCGDRLRRRYGLEVAQAQLRHREKSTTEKAYAPSSSAIVRDALLKSKLIESQQVLSDKTAEMVPEGRFELPTYALRMRRLIH